MKKGRIIAIVMGVIVLGIISLFVFKLCPPSGPWPMPPWCAENAYIPYSYEELDYISGEAQDLDLYIGTFDIWGNPHLYMDLGEDTRDHYEATMKKIGDIGSDGLFLSDFIGLDLNKAGEGIEEISPSELNKIVKAAKGNGISKVMLVAGLIDPEGAMKRYKGEDDSFNLEYSSLDDWKQHILKVAEKSENAGVDQLVISPGILFFLKFEDDQRLNDYYNELIPLVKEKFSGEIGIQSQLHGLNRMNFLDSMDFVVVNWEPNDFNFQQESVTEDLDSMEQAFTNWMNKIPQVNKLYISVTMPSYDGAIKKGWIEPGAVYGPEYVIDYKEQAMMYEAIFRSVDPSVGVISYGYWWTDRIYPEIKVLRNDIAHSIRNKDAEHVFAKWSGKWK